MRYGSSILGGLLKPIDRRQFDAIVERHDGNAYDKRFDSWTHLISLICGQLSGASSLRELEAAWRANGHHHYHLGVGELRRSTLSAANRRRPSAVFAELLDLLIGQARGGLRREARELVKLIDASPIMVKTAPWARWNGRIRGLKLHVEYDPVADLPERLAITSATVNDIAFGRQTPIERGTTYVVDRAYCSYPWWTEIHQAGAFFVTRHKTLYRLRNVRTRPVEQVRGDGFVVLSDRDVERSARTGPRYDLPLRKIRIRRSDGRKLTLITNDTERSAVEIAHLYKGRWRIELLFRWIKQHLNIRRFLGTSENAVRLQILAAMIAFLLLRIAAALHRITALPIRFAQLVGQCLFVRKPLLRIDKPPEVHPTGRSQCLDPNQLCFRYA